MARISVNTKYNLQLAAHKGKNFYENTTHRYFFDDEVATDCIILKVTRVPKKYLGRRIYDCNRYIYKVFR